MDLIINILIIVLLFLLILMVIIMYYKDRGKEFYVEFPITFKWNVVINFDGAKTITLGVYNIKQ